MEWLIILILILTNGFFSMAEMAVVSSRKSRLAAAAKEGKSGAQTAYSIAQMPTPFLSTVQMGITLVGLLTGLYSGEKFARALEQQFVRIPAISSFASEIALTTILLIITFLTLVLGELVPKRIGLTRPERIARAVAPFMQLLSRVVHPFVWLLTQTSEAIVRLLRLRPAGNLVTEEEIKAIVQEGTQGGEVRVIERDIVERVFALGDRTIASLMTTRSEITFIDINSGTDEVIAAINHDLHRIYPVIDGDKDNIIGVVHLKDMFRALASDRFILAELLRPAQFLNETVSAYSALERFRRVKSNYSLVTNEYGMVIGIATVDDILHGLVGDIYDPDESDTQIFRRPDGTWLVDGEYPLVEFEMFFDVERSEELENVNTVAGLVLHQLSRIPRVGERVRWKDFEFEVVDLDKVRIDKVLVRKLEG